MIGTIGLVKVGVVDDSVMNFLKEGLEVRFQKEVVIDSGLPLPSFAYNKDRHQYYSTSIIKVISDSFYHSDLHRWQSELREESQRNYDKVLGIVDEDLYVHGLNFVFGEAEGIPGRVGLISITRLKQEFYGLPRDNDLFYERALKEAVHEVGHLYGLYHCSDTNCVMHFSNSLVDTDHKSTDFCANCKKKLKDINHR